MVFRFLWTDLVHSVSEAAKPRLSFSAGLSAEKLHFCLICRCLDQTCVLTLHVFRGCSYLSAVLSKTSEDPVQLNRGTSSCFEMDESLRKLSSLCSVRNSPNPIWTGRMTACRFEDTWMIIRKTCWTFSARFPAEVATEQHQSSTFHPGLMVGTWVQDEAADTVQCISTSCSQCREKKCVHENWNVASWKAAGNGHSSFCWRRYSEFDKAERARPKECQDRDTLFCAHLFLLPCFELIAALRCVVCICACA